MLKIFSLRYIHIYLRLWYSYFYGWNCSQLTLLTFDSIRIYIEGCLTLSSITSWRFNVGNTRCPAEEAGYQQQQHFCHILFVVKTLLQAQFLWLPPQNGAFSNSSLYFSTFLTSLSNSFSLSLSFCLSFHQKAIFVLSTSSFWSILFSFFCLRQVFIGSTRSLYINFLFLCLIHSHSLSLTLSISLSLLTLSPHSLCLSPTLLPCLCLPSSSILNHSLSLTFSKSHFHPIFKCSGSFLVVLFFSSHSRQRILFERNVSKIHKK